MLSSYHVDCTLNELNATMFSDCGFFCTIWMFSVYAWPVIALVLLAGALTGIFWKTLRWRRQLVAVSVTLLVIHLAHNAFIYIRY